MAVILGSNTVTGLNSLTVATSTTLNGTATAVTPTTGDVSTRIANATFIDKTGSRPQIDWVAVNGYNSFLIRSNGKVYEGHATASFDNYNSGRALVNECLITGLDRMSQVPVPDSSPVVKCAAVGLYSWALCANGNLYMWGYNGYGQLGLGHTTNMALPTLSATGVTDVYWNKTNSCCTAAEARSIIKKSDGYIYTCGYNGYGQLGVGDTANRSTWTQVTAAGTNPLFVAPMGANFGMTVVQKSDKSIWMCGINGYGQMGNGNGTNQSSLIDVSTAWKGSNSNLLIKGAYGGFGYYVSSNPDYTTLALWLDDGTTSYMKTCGANNWGQLGNGTTTNTSTPYTVTQVSGGTGTTRIKDAGWASADVVGGMHVVLENGNLYSWGYNGYGQLGTGDTSDRPTPTVTASGVTKVWGDQAEHSYGHYHTSFIQKTDGLYAAGRGDYGQGGWGDTSNRSSWTKVGLSQNAHNNLKMLGQWSSTGSTRIYVGVTNDNTLYAWGYNGQYGIFPWNSVSNIASPVTFELMRGD